MEKDRALFALSLAMKAGKLVSGEFMTERSIKDGEAKLVIIADDASPGTTKNFSELLNPLFNGQLPTRFNKNWREIPHFHKWWDESLFC